MKTFLLISILLTSLNINAQEESVNDSSNICDEIFTIVEEMPEFPGGEIKLLKYLAGLEFAICFEDWGRIFLKFIINKEGEIINVRVVDQSEECENEVKQQVSNMPIWKPGYQRGKPVCVEYIIPIRWGH